MSKEEKINQLPEEGQPSKENENISDENIQHTALNTQPNQENMEVHKHPHHVTHKKKWGEYLLEFFMLFLAVFLGFVAENVREGTVERHKEKEYMQSLISDLERDTIIINTTNKINIRNAGNDSVFVLLLRTNKKDSATISKLSNLYHKTTVFDVELNEPKTFDQLKSTGDFRLIKNKKVQDSISKYYQKIAEYKIWRDEIQSNLLLSYNFSYKVLDNYGLSNHLTSSPYITTNQQDINEYSNYIFGLSLQFKRYAFSLEQFKSNAIRLVAVIKKEYHLENE